MNNNNKQEEDKPALLTIFSTDGNKYIRLTEKEYDAIYEVLNELRTHNNEFSSLTSVVLTFNKRNRLFSLKYKPLEIIVQINQTLLNLANAKDEK